MFRRIMNPYRGTKELSARKKHKDVRNKVTGHYSGDGIRKDIG